MRTVTRSDVPVGRVARRRAAGAARRQAGTGRSYAVAISRAKPSTLRQSGRLAVTSKSITASAPSALCAHGATDVRRRRLDRRDLEAAQGERLGDRFGRATP